MLTELADPENTPVGIASLTAALPPTDTDDADGVGAGAPVV
jgi:hypothetical protein